MKNSIAFVVDPQIQFSNPANRIDNYFEALIKKLGFILDNNRYVVILGDLTEFPVLDMQGIIILIGMLQKHKKAGGQVYSLIGNHDIYSWNISTITKSTLGLLAKLGLITIIDKSGEVPEALHAVSSVEINDWTIDCTLLKTPHEQIPIASSERSILIGHNYYHFERDTKHSLEYDEIANLGYKYVLLGHDHEPYQPKVIEGGILYRPGSLGRQTIHSYNFTRKIQYCRLDLDVEKMTTEEVPFEPASEVFSVEAIEKHEDTTPAFVYDLEELMKNFKNKSTINMSIKKMMEDNPEISDEIISFIEDCHEACGLEFV